MPREKLPSKAHWFSFIRLWNKFLRLTHSSVYTLRLNTPVYVLDFTQNLKSKKEIKQPRDMSHCHHHGHHHDDHRHKAMWWGRVCWRQVSNLDRWTLLATEAIMPHRHHHNHHWLHHHNHHHDQHHHHWYHHHHFKVSKQILIFLVLIHYNGMENGRLTSALLM